VNLKSTRDAYGECLAEIGEDKRIVVLDADLASSTKTEVFAKKYPERFFNVGCAEQNLIGMAAGFAYAGKIAIASTYAIFGSGRAWEVIRQLVAYDNLNVKIVVSHSGLTNGLDGVSHHSIEDIALICVIPNMRVVVPADAIETREAIRMAVRIPGPFYIRLNRTATPVIFEPKNYKFELGKGMVLEEGLDVAVIATGTMLYKALEAATLLRREGISTKVVNIHTIKPIDKELLMKVAKETGAIVTAEEHSIIGGLGSAVAEVLASLKPIPIEFVGVKDVFTQTGKPEELYKAYGLTVENIIRAAKNVISRGDSSG
jgi:transketolase